MALDVYADSGKGSRIYSWSRQNFLGDPQSGFFAAGYRTPRTNRLVVAFRGTNEFRADWVNNVLNTTGLASFCWDSQLNTALAYFRAVRALHPAAECAVCGHSLGGFLASMVALREGVLGVTFNPAPLGLSTSGLPSRTTPGAPPARLVNFRLKGDVVSGMRQSHIGKAIELKHSKTELLLRASGLLGDLDPLMHSMALMNEAVLRDDRSALPPEAWA